MADDNKLIVELKFVDNSSKKVFSEIEKQAKETSQKISSDQIVIQQNINKTISKSTSEANSLTEKLVGSLRSVSTLIATAPPTGKGIFGLITSLTFTSNALLVLSNRIEKLDNQLAKDFANSIKVVAFALDAFGFAVSFAIERVSLYAFRIGTDLVNALQSVAKESQKAALQTETFQNVIKNFNIATNDAIGSTKSWQTLISGLSEEFNILTGDLEKAAQEIILVGSQLGLNERQLKDLTRISAEYAKINGKEVFPVALAFVKALNGQSQAAQTLGVKLTQSAVSAFALKKGYTDNFQALKDGTKVQIRYEKLLQQYSNVVGIASEKANSFNDATNKLNTQLNNFTTEFGKGVAIIENYNLAASALTLITDNISNGFVKFLGFSSALGSRLLQITGLLVNLGFKAFIATKAINALRIALSSKESILRILQTRIPLINRSLVELFDTFNGGKTNVAQVASGLQGLGVNLTKVSSALAAIKKSPIKSIFALLSLGINLVTSSLTKLLVVAAPFLAIFAKLAVVVGVIVGVFKLLRSAFVTIEERTQVFSESYQILLTALSETGSFFQPIIDIFVNFGKVVQRVASQAFGLLISAITKTFSLISGVVARNPFGVFSDQTVAKFAAIQDRLNGFNDQLIANDFILKEYTDSANRYVAGVTDAGGKIGEKASEQATGVLDLLKSVKVGFSSTANKLKQQAQQVESAIESSLVTLISGGIQNVIKSLKAGENAFQNFVNFVLGTFGDLAIQLGNTLILTGLGIESLKTLKGAAAVAAGAGLVALGAILKAFSGDGGGGGAPTNTSGIVPDGTGVADIATAQDTTSDEEIERQTSSSVNITVEGSLVQQEELGSFISNVLSESNEKNGNVILNPRFA